MLTQQQIKWAKGHDWFNHDNKDGTIIVQEHMLNSDSSNLITFGSFTALKEWAGY